MANNPCDASATCDDSTGTAMCTCVAPQVLQGNACVGKNHNTC